MVVVMMMENTLILVDTLDLENHKATKQLPPKQTTGQSIGPQKNCCLEIGSIVGWKDWSNTILQ